MVEETAIPDPLAADDDLTVLRATGEQWEAFVHHVHYVPMSAGAQGLAARYVSGYLETLPPPGQIKLQGADASHAWAQVWCPGTSGVAASSASPRRWSTTAKPSPSGSTRSSSTNAP